MPETKHEFETTCKWLEDNRFLPDADKIKLLRTL
jgi:hypothetical protein